MRFARKAQDPVVLSYLALRKAVGGVALGLPFVLAIPWWVLHGHVIEASISSYYYTGMRNLFIGALCAISMFMLCCRGYDLKDELAGVFSSFCAIGVAFFPTEPDSGVTPLQHRVAIAHYIFAATLFSTLAYFCLVLFKMSAKDVDRTPQKFSRNKVYTACGGVIILSMILLAILKLLKVEYLAGHLASTFCFESTALIAFGIAWLTKGETFLKDVKASSSNTRATDNHVLSLYHSAHGRLEE